MKNYVTTNLILDDQGGQQISVRTDGKSPTLRAEMHGNLPCVCSAGFKPSQGAKAKGMGFEMEKSPTLLAGQEPGVCITFEPGIASRDGGHVYEGVSGTLRATPGDNQMTVAYDIGEARLRNPQEYIEKSPTITARCGTGGNNVPAVVFENHAQDSRYKGPLKVAQPVTATYGMGGNNQPLVICLQGNGIDRADTAGCNGKGWTEDVSYTLEKDDKTIVINTIGGVAESAVWASVCPTIKASHYKFPQQQQIEQGKVVIEMGDTEYIVRRLTPLECCRLQGFPDGWAEIDPKEDFTDEEYEFWLDVRKTFAEINGKQIKEWTKDQMLTWYNKLHTDSAEYKMWGNGIALPCALYVMQGIAEISQL